MDAALSTRRRGGESVVRVDPAGKRALSWFRAVERLGDRATLVEVSIGTGRTHQIRVHAAHAGHPWRETRDTAIRGSMPTCWRRA